MADAVQTLRAAEFPLPAQAVALKPVFDLGWSLYSMVKDIISDPPKAFSAGKALIEVAVGVRNQQAMEDRTAFLEVHYRLGWDLRNWFSGGIHMEKLFGTSTIMSAPDPILIPPAIRAMPPDRSRRPGGGARE